MQSTFDPKTSKITHKFDDGTLISEMSFSEWHARSFVFKHLSYKGELYNKILSAAEENHCWTLADGFCPGWTIEDIAKQLEWDWSHIRDSSEAAMKEIANYILAKHYAGAPTIEQQEAKWLAACKAAGVNPTNPAEKMEL